jgi:hypothetical protein
MPEPPIAIVTPVATPARWFGYVAAVANTFLSQELVRILFAHMDRISAGQRITGGWMRLSGAAWPAAAVFWASHIWVLVVLRRWIARPGSRGAAPLVDRGLVALALIEILLIHSLVLSFRGTWHIDPGFLW